MKLHEIAIIREAVCVYFDYTGAGRGPEPVAGPFNSEAEAKQWFVDNEIDEKDPNYFIDEYRE